VGRATDRRTNIDGWTSLHRRYYRLPAFILRSGQSGLRPILGILALLAALHLTGREATAADVTSTWIDGDGFWSTAGNWDPAVVPNNTATDTYAVRIENGSTVTLDTSVTVDTVLVDFVSPPASTLVLGAGQTLNVNQLFNLSLVGVTGPGTGALASSGFVANVGTLFANGGGNLQITNSQVNSNGTIVAQDGSTVTLQNTFVSGGTLTTSGTGVIEADLATLQNLTNAGFYRIGDATFVEQGVVTNTGIFARDTPGTGFLEMDPGAVLRNNGTLQASGGGTLVLKGPNGFPVGTNIDNTAGTIVAQNGSVVSLQNPWISGGTLTTSGTGVIEADLATLQNLTNAGFYRIGDATFVEQGVVTNTGIFARDIPGTGFLEIDPGGVLTNNGTVQASGGGTLVLRVDLGGVLTNNGTLRAGGGSSLVLQGPPFGGPGTVQNAGTFQVEAGGDLTLSGVGFSNFDATTGTLTGGTYQVTGALRFDGANIVTNAATIVLDTLGSQILDETNQDGLRNFAANTGSFTLQGGRNLSTPGSFTNSGAMNVAGGSSLSVGGPSYVQTAGTTIVDGSLLAGSLVDIRGGTLSGNGLVGPNVKNSGTVAPGTPPAAGVLFVGGDYTQTVSGILNIVIGGLTAGTDYSLLRVFGNAVLAGALDVDLINGFDPTTDAFFDILTTGVFLPGSVSGTFGTLDLPISPFGTWSVEYLSDRVRIDFAVGGTGTVPEPPSILLMIVALGILAIIQRHRWRCGQHHRLSDRHRDLSRLLPPRDQRAQPHPAAELVALPRPADSRLRGSWRPWRGYLSGRDRAAT
jgi:hypothetical protein